MPHWARPWLLGLGPSLTARLSLQTAAECHTESRQLGCMRLQVCHRPIHASMSRPSAEIACVHMCTILSSCTHVPVCTACRAAERASPGSYAAAAARSLRSRLSSEAGAAPSSQAGNAASSDAAAPSTSGRGAPQEPRLTFYLKGTPLRSSSTIFQVRGPTAGAAGQVGWLLRSGGARACAVSIMPV